MAALSAFVYVTLGLLLLVLLASYSPSSRLHHHGSHRRLKLRDPAAPPSPPGRHHAAPFDPLIAEIELHRDDREWERTHFDMPAAPGHEPQPEWEDFIDAEDYINDEDRFNVTHRIVLLFPKIDVAPIDGRISLDELTDWNLQQAGREVMHRTKRDMDLHDKNHDGFVSFDEYEPPSWSLNAEDGSTWWKREHFDASDVDGNGVLNLTEFNDFLHPADSSSPKLIHWLCKEEIRERDKDKDGKLNFQEYFHGLFDSIRNYEEAYNQSDSMEAPANKLFKELDKDNDGFLSVDELIPVISNLHPSERYYAKQQAEYVITQADADKDGQLSLKEMVEHPYVFYSSIFTEDDDDSDYHDEFR
ncbi:LOW QUALITY PROTEIN: calumenin-like [Dioscorea cayenensis subsp. rotundata]|uniref:LOW QUALITY PROTEIN: calumenin-like n=1 Tax=Dioscorea cayennensis subsp. rotundata TaxID=55577 RepID=A0AB40ANY7_DIOCR|nr:LOW QUALITY PROTEIN: calumenin-like [Dioscorea cayenensis subsp. rotundata]